MRLVTKSSGELPTSSTSFFQIRKILTVLKEKSLDWLKLKITWVNRQTAASKSISQWLSNTTKNILLKYQFMLWADKLQLKI